MMENQVAGRRRTTTKHSAEDQALDQIAKEDNPLVLFTKFLVKTVEEKNFTESVLDIEAFKKSFSSLDNYVENFMYTKKWISETVIHLCSVALIKCFPAYSQQHPFLRTICDNRLNTELPVNVPDFLLLLSLTECLAKEGLTLDYTLICTDNQNFQLEKQLENLFIVINLKLLTAFLQLLDFLMALY
ncbi:uncharacterized protein LOC142324836 [Lycorma delicatula]|uniref:uncharacterized protein LOC142324836 n=1 Tax=Lycorma delicatula TaxID=130591 RepID=UPI003F518045